MVCQSGLCYRLGFVEKSMSLPFGKESLGFSEANRSLYLENSVFLFEDSVDIMMKR